VEWSEIDIDRRQWTIPREKAKNDRAHEVHLSWLAIEVLDRLPKIGDRYVLTTSGARPVSGFSRSKERLDRHMLDLSRAEFARKHCLTASRACPSIAAKRQHEWRNPGALDRSQQPGNPGGLRQSTPKMPCDKYRV
jgi:hypothetical protein